MFHWRRKGCGFGLSGRRDCGLERDRHVRPGRRPHGQGGWEDSEDNARVTFKVEARRIGILPHRLTSVAMREKGQDTPNATPKGAGKKAPRKAG